MTLTVPLPAIEPDEGEKVKKFGWAEASFQLIADLLGFLMVNVAEVDDVPKSMLARLLTRATRVGDTVVDGALVVVVVGAFVVVGAIDVVVDPAAGETMGMIVVAGAPLVGVTGPFVVGGVELGDVVVGVVSFTVVSLAAVELTGGSLSTVDGATMAEGVSWFDVSFVPPPTVNTATEPAATSATTPVVHHTPRRAMRPGNPSLVRKRMGRVVPVPAPLPGIGMCDVASSTR